MVILVAPLSGQSDPVVGGRYGKVAATNNVTAKATAKCYNPVRERQWWNSEGRGVGNTRRKWREKEKKNQV